ncbi:MAG: HAD family phosphatase [Candidatus Aenigmarchaeota archaeon]|nr:HAD family phosphatase [Candidatus Aenigmarchaeota archaeon]
MIKAVIFDWDGTLADSLKYHYAAYKVALEPYMKLKPGDIYKREGGKSMDIISDLLRNVQIDEYEMKRIVERKQKYYKYNAVSIRMLPGGRKLIENLRKLNFKIGLATGTHREGLMMSLKEDEVGLFDYILTADETKKAKPDPEPYINCMKALDVRPEETVVIENAPLGVESAKSAGCLCVAITSTVKKEDLKRADFVVGSLDEVGDIIKSL